MITWHVGVKHELGRVATGCRDKQWLSEWYQGTKDGYEQSKITISVMDDGCLSLWEEGGEHYIYLHKEQVDHLKAILEEGA